MNEILWTLGVMAIGLFLIGGIIGIIGALAGTIVTHWFIAKTKRENAVSSHAKNDNKPEEKQYSTSPDKVKVTVSDQAGGKTVTAELPTTPPMSRLLPALVTKMQLPSNTNYGIMHKETGKQLSGNDTLKSVGVRDGDTLRVVPNVTAGGGIPIRSFREIQLVDAILNHGDLIRHIDKQAVFAVFLYTKEDKELASYIREHIDELNEMAGHYCLFFTIEQPTPEWDKSIRGELGELAGDYFDALWERLGTENFKPYEKAQAYNIARRFGLEVNQLPCVVLFSELKSREIIVIEFNKFIDPKQQDLPTEYTKFCRALFSVTQRVANQPRTEWQSQIGKLMATKWKETTHKEVKPIDPTTLAVPFIEIIGTLIKTIT